jgi:hypothetical protein
MQLHVSTSIGLHPFKVLIRSLTGEYLAGSEGQWRLTKDRSTALVCDYLRDRIADQLERLERTEGIVLLAEPINPREALETCDRCDRSVASIYAHFDGKQFLCPDCNSKQQQ